jgi:pimeloyl-ACP methyl ester carboxylesterase
MGHSMGGKTAMWYAHKFPNKLEKMIVVDIGIKQYPMHHNEIIKGIRSVPLENVASRSEAEKSLLPFVDSYGVRQFLLKNLYWKEKGQLAWRMNVDVLEREMTEILSTLEMEENWTVSLFIRGELSNYILDEDWEEIEAVFPDSSLVTIQDAGHWVHAEKPEIFIDTVLGFCLR